MQDQSPDPVPALIRDIVATNTAHGRAAALELCSRGLEAFPGDPRLLAVASGLQPVLALWMPDPTRRTATTPQEVRAWLDTEEARRHLGEWVLISHGTMCGHGPTRDDIAGLFKYHPDAVGVLVEEELLTDGRPHQERRLREAQLQKLEAKNLRAAAERWARGSAYSVLPPEGNPRGLNWVGDKWTVSIDLCGFVMGVGVGVRMLRNPDCFVGPVAVVVAYDDRPDLANFGHTPFITRSIREDGTVVPEIERAVLGREAPIFSEDQFETLIHATWCAFVSKLELTTEAIRFRRRVEMDR